MFLKRLELVGFKSFAARTVLELDPAIDVIVGPNGSGKSNLADAVRWVLGEQSMRAVRSKRSEDVIFAGSASRAPLGMAEVSLILDNSDERLPLPFAEVRVTRRLYRSGESEYLLNGSRVRLKDITECLTHAGLGPDSYCVIGQGAVEELILQRPEERRLAFESAADIRRHQLKLAETRSRLESTEQNLTRCQDVMAELEPHLRRLRGQAERAERARRLRGELAGLATAWYRRRLGEARQALERAEAAYQAAEAERQRLEAALAEHEAAQQELDAVAEATERRLRELRPRVEALRAEHEAVQREAAVAEERLAQLGQRLSDDGPDLQELRERVARLEAEASAARQARDEQEAALGAQRQRLAAARERLHVEEQELARRQRVLVTLEREHAQKVAQRDELERQRAAAEPRAEAAQREASDSAAARAEAEQALGELQARLAAERERARALEQQAQAGAAESAHARQDQAEAARRVADLQQAVLAAEREAARLEAALRQLAPGRAAPAATTLPPSAGELGAALLGLLGERLYIPAAYELALAAGLDGLARALVLRCSVDRERLAASLLQARGRWTLLALEAADGAETRAFQRQARARLAGCTVHGFGDELLESPPELAPLVAACLGRTVVVDDSDLLEAYGRLTAEEELARPWQVVSLSGHRARSGGEWLVGLGAEVDPLLSIERERRRLAAELAALRARLPALEAELAEQRRAQEQAGEGLRALAQARAGQEAELRQSRAQAQELERQLGRREQDRRRAE
ncbi:MAG: AAA family ATPase, partial [Chloroflexi bacterium]|nr:AAA family ATPase [Chloroflexota bacterium]